MKHPAIKFAVAIILVLFITSFANAQYHFDLTPSLTIGETYDDNIYLDPDHETSDYITTVSPGFNLDLVGHHTTLGLSYAPTFVRYADKEDNNTVRHDGTLTLSHDLGRYLHFDLEDTYLRSEQPLGATAIQGIRNTRNTYQRNTGSASIGYTFGPQNSLTAGYRHSLLENDDPTIDDGREQSPFATATLWLNVSNGLEFSYDYINAQFSRDDGIPAGDEYTGQSAGIRYIYRFNPHQEWSVGYTITTRDFDGATEDYKVHDWSAGYNQDISQHYSIHLTAGYFIQDNDKSSDESGITYIASVSKSFSRGSVTVGGEGGWNEIYLQAERRGFTRYWGLNFSLEYQLLAPLTGYADGIFRHDKDAEDIEWDTSRATLGVRWAFLRWFSASLEYTYAKRDSDVDADDYTDNQVMLTITGSRLFRW